MHFEDQTVVKLVEDGQVDVPLGAVGLAVHPGVMPLELCELRRELKRLKSEEDEKHFVCIQWVLPEHYQYNGFYHYGRFRKVERTGAA